MRLSPKRQMQLMLIISIHGYQVMWSCLLLQSKVDQKCMKWHFWGELCLVASYSMWLRETVWQLENNITAYVLSIANWMVNARACWIRLEQGMNKANKLRGSCCADFNHYKHKGATSFTETWNHTPNPRRMREGVRRTVSGKLFTSSWCSIKERKFSPNLLFALLPEVPSCLMLILKLILYNSPFPSCCMPQYQNESWCTAIHMEMSCLFLCKSN